MSDEHGLPLLLVGASGLIGSAVIAMTAQHSDVPVVALARREMVFPRGARLEMVVADPADWHAAIVRARPAALAIALGTTLAAQGGDRRGFRAVDHDLVIAIARAARLAGTRQIILVSSAGADPESRNFYLSVKGEIETALIRMKFPRIDILRPGLLRGRRIGTPRRFERIGQIVAPLIDPFLRGQRATWRSVHARDVAAAILHLAARSGRGRHVHGSVDIRRLAREG